jgi:hypothetical protein
MDSTVELKHEGYALCPVKECNLATKDEVLAFEVQK